MKIISTTNGESLIFKPSGNLTSSNCSSIKKFVSKKLGESSHIIFDLEEVNFVDSSGIGMLAILQKKIKSLGGKMVIVNLMDNVSLVFQVTRAFEIFEVYDCVTTAQLKVAV